MFRLIIQKSVLIVFLSYILPIYAQTSAQFAEFAKAAKFDDLTQVRALITSGMDPNSVDLKGDPMLVIAIRDKSSKVTEYLLNNKQIDVDLSNKLGETPLMLAAIDGDLPLVKRLVLKNKAQIDHIGWTPLLYACSKGRLEVAQFLVDNGADVNALSPNGSTLRTTGPKGTCFRQSISTMRCSSIPDRVLSLNSGNLIRSASSGN